jgi:hypothetical protein
MRNRVLEATIQDPCGRLPAPDSYAGSAAPSITGFGGHPTRFSPTQGVARDIDDSYACQGIRMAFSWSHFRVLKDGERGSLLGCGHDREGPLG